MRALTFDTYGDFNVLKVKRLEKPLVQKDEYLVKVHSSSLTTAESMMRRANPFIVRLMLGFLKPKQNISGACFSGIVIQDGNKILDQSDQFSIFGEIGPELGANADYIVVKKSATIMRKPDHLSFAQAACLCDGTMTSYYFLHHLMKPKKGQSILINGATGSLGLAAIQFAKELGLNIIATCSENNFELVKKNGAEKVISYKRKDFEDQLSSITQFDFIFDCVGKLPPHLVKKIMKRNGSYFCPVISFNLLMRQLKNAFSTQKVYFAAVGMLSPKILKKYMQEIMELAAQNKVEISINRIFELNNAIEAHKIIDSGHKTGNFVLKHI